MLRKEGNLPAFSSLSNTQVNHSDLWYQVLHSGHLGSTQDLYIICIEVCRLVEVYTGAKLEFTHADIIQSTSLPICGTAHFLLYIFSSLSYCSSLYENSEGLSSPQSEKSLKCGRVVQHRS